MDLERKDDREGRSVNSSDDDKNFLLNFIMGTYLGPDVTFDTPRNSAFQRLAKDSPPYTSKDLGPSYVSMALLENLYYYVLRKAERSLILKPDMLHEYIKGSLHFPNLSMSEDTRRFVRLFPLDLHEQIWYPQSFRIVKGIVLIDDPVMSHREGKNLEKFRSLSRLNDFKIDMDEFVQFEHNYCNGNDDDDEQNCLDSGKETTSTGHKISGWNAHPSVRSQRKFKRRRDDCDSVVPMFPVGKDHTSKGDFKRAHICDGPAIMPLLLDVQKCIAEIDVSIVLSGIAKKGKPGPPVGVVDVGVSKVAYYFRVALPGVRKDYCKFSCEIESAGNVHVRGLTTGGKTIRKPSRVFEMKFQQLCPPGPFTLSFSLPGPVDPRLFAPNFRSDGIFEGVIIKHAKK